MLDEIDFREGTMPWGDPPQRNSSFGKWLRIYAVTGVIGILIGLLMPACQSRRINHGEMQCASNLRQMGLGIAAYLNAFNVYPPGTIPNANLPLERRLGWGITLLPYLDDVERAKTSDELAHLAWDDTACADLIAHPRSITHCPASQIEANFFGIAGLGPDAPSLPTNHPRAGLFGDDRQVTLADVKDGTAQTMMLAETDTLPGPWFAGGRATVRGLDPARQPYVGPNRQLGGLHGDSANALMADGSIKRIRSTIDPKILEALTTIAGKEAVPTDFDER